MKTEPKFRRLFGSSTAHIEAELNKNLREE